MNGALLLALVLFSATGVARAESPFSGLVNGQAPSACRAGMRVYESERGRQLLGEVIQADFPRLLPDWNKEMATYEPAAEDVQVLAGIEEDIVIICVLGTWCGDSRREVPRFWKILQDADNPHLDLGMFGVGRSSDSEAREILDSIGFDEPLRETYDVELVPTFIFLKDGMELGRIVETPETSLEQDAVRILTSVEAEGSAWH